MNQNPPLRIALIEDARGDVRWFRLVLGEAGIPHELTVYAAGNSALDCFSRNPPPDLIVSDWGLPAMEFSEFMQAVRAIPAYESTPVAVFTGIADPIRGQAIALGAICCFEKPVSVEQLRNLLRRIWPTTAPSIDI